MSTQTFRPASVDIHQFKKETSRMRRLRLPPFSPMSQMKTWLDSALSKRSWATSALVIHNTKFAYDAP